MNKSASSYVTAIYVTSTVALLMNAVLLVLYMSTPTNNHQKLQAFLHRDGRGRRSDIDIDAALCSGIF